MVAISGAILGGLNKVFGDRKNTTVFLQKMLDTKFAKGIKNLTFRKLNEMFVSQNFPDPSMFARSLPHDFIKYRQKRSEKRREPRFINLKQIGNFVQVKF